MSANKKHTRNQWGYVYIGVNGARRKHGRGKIGTTEQKRLNDRINTIRHYERDFVVCAYLKVQNCTKAQLEFIESYMRMMLEQYFQHTQNDHFEFDMCNKAQGYNGFVNLALEFATEACHMQHFQYSLNYCHEFGKGKTLTLDWLFRDALRLTSQ